MTIYKNAEDRTYRMEQARKLRATNTTHALIAVVMIPLFLFACWMTIVFIDHPIANGICMLWLFAAAFGAQKLAHATGTAS